VKPLTVRQSQVFEFIRTYIEEESIPPTQQEIGDALDLWPNGVTGHLKLIESKGYITLLQGKSRGIRLNKIL
jgi:repressor LexA